MILPNPDPGASPGRRPATRVAGLLAALLLAGLLASPSLAAETRLTGVVNVNTATLTELQMLPGIGESRAQAVLEARKARGGFAKLDDLLEVKGIGTASLERLRPHLVVKGKTTVKLQ